MNAQDSSVLIGLLVNMVDCALCVHLHLEDGTLTVQVPEYGQLSYVTVVAKHPSAGPCSRAVSLSSLDLARVTVGHVTLELYPIAAPPPLVNPRAPVVSEWDLTLSELRSVCLCVLMSGTYVVVKGTPRETLVTSVFECGIIQDVLPCTSRTEIFFMYAAKLFKLIHLASGDGCSVVIRSDGVLECVSGVASAVIYPHPLSDSRYDLSCGHSILVA